MTLIGVHWWGIRYFQILAVTNICASIWLVGLPLLWYHKDDEASTVAWRWWYRSWRAGEGLQGLHDEEGARDLDVTLIRP